MKRLVAILAILSFALGACSRSEPPVSGDGLKVYASIFPVYDFAKNIGGDKIDLHAVMPSGAEAHDWEPSTQDIVNLEKADVFIYNGAGMEHWVDAMLASLRNDGLVIVDTSANVTLLGTDVGRDEDGDSHGHGGGDPHIWLSVSNAKAQAGAIADAFSAADPGNSSYYAENLRIYHEKLDALDADYRAALDGLENKGIVVAHMAYGYLCGEYELTQVSARGYSPDQEPDPASMAKVVDYCRANDIKVIFFENPADPQTANTIAAEIGASVDVLSPIESLYGEDIGREDYISMMRRNLEALKKALS